MEFVPFQVDDSLLRQAFQQQEELQLSRWNKRKQCLSSQELDTKYGQRRECARQIQAMCRYFEAMSPAVFASSVGIMDSALIRVNIPWKYLSCFSAACFIIGSKWVEDEFQPSIVVLADLHYKQWKEVDLRRMEEKILQVLGWEIPRCTYVNFLPHMTRALASRCQSLNLPPVSHVIRNAELLLLKEFSFILKPAAVALGALEHALRQCGAFTPDLSFAVVALQDSVKVLDSELHEIGQVLSMEDSLQQEAYKSNKAYFPKVFETPCDSFLPDHRLYNIPEECSDAESDLRSGRQGSAVHHHSSPSASISDYDYSDEEDDEPTGSCTDEEDNEPRSSTTETETVDKCKVTPDCTVLRENIIKQSVGEESTGDVSELDRNLECASECEQFSRTVLDPALFPDATEQSSTAEHSGSIMPVTGPTNNSEEHFSNEDNHSDSDSGCEQESDDDDEQDSCNKHDPCERVSCSEQDSSEQDSGCDQDSDFHDSSPCSICHVKACLNEVQASQALTFN